MKNQIIRKQKFSLTNQKTQLLSLGREFDWGFKVLGNAPIPEESVQVENWLIVPAHLDNSIIPNRALHRIQTVYQSGIRPACWVVVHEAPNFLAPPMEPNKRPEIWPYIMALGGLGVFLASTVITTVAIVDPILIAITPEHDWIEIDRWV